jgi:hypothetical protein
MCTLVLADVPGLHPDCASRLITQGCCRPLLLSSYQLAGVATGSQLQSLHKAGGFVLTLRRYGIPEFTADLIHAALQPVILFSISLSFVCVCVLG